MAEPLKFPKQVPVFPLSNVVLYPYLDLPLYIFEPRYKKMLKDVLEGDHLIAMVLIKEGGKKKEPAPIYDVAGVGMVKFATKNEDGTSTIIVGGLARARLTKRMQEKPYLISEFEILENILAESNEEVALTEKVKELFIRKERMTKLVTQEHMENIYQLEDPSRLCDIISFFSSASYSQKQQVLETLNIASRLRLVLKILEAEIQRLESKN